MYVVDRIECWRDCLGVRAVERWVFAYQICADALSERYVRVDVTCHCVRATKTERGRLYRRVDSRWEWLRMRAECRDLWQQFHGTR